LLLKFGIRAGKISRVEDEPYKTRYRFGISHRNDLRLFAEKIDFNHPNKKEKLQISLNSYSRPHYCKMGETKNLIARLLKNSSLTRCEISDRLNRPVSSLEGHLQKLEKDGTIKSIRNRKRIKVYYINQDNPEEGAESEVSEKGQNLLQVLQQTH